MKYIGSKPNIADEIVAILQEYISAYGIRQYVEPFAGGFSIISKIHCNYKLGNDFDPIACKLAESTSRGILVGCCDYQDLRFPTHERVLIYCDPPHLSGIGYGGKKFDTAAFWEWCRRQTTAGHIVVVSEYTAPDDFVCVWEKETTTHLNNRAKHGRVEKLFIHGGEQWQK